MEIDCNLKTLANVFKLFRAILFPIFIVEFDFYPQIKVISSVKCSKIMFLMGKVAYHLFQNSLDHNIIFIPFNNLFFTSFLQPGIVFVRSARPVQGRFPNHRPQG